MRRAPLFAGHPRGLGGLFFTEAWERFSYYGMRAILLYYMYGRISEGGLGFPSDTAKSLIAVYGSAIYLAAIAGGWVSDRLLGARRSTLLGGLLIMCGHVCLALPAGRPALFASMIFIVLGTGLLKPTISSSVGDLYSDDTARRDAGFSIYYMGISVGAVVAPFAVGTVGQRWNYHLGFSLAAVGMAIGLVVYLVTSRHLSPVSRSPKNPIELQAVPAGRKVIVGAAGCAVVAAVLIAAVSGALTADRVVDLVSALSIVLPIAYFVVMLRSRRTSRAERARVRAYIPLFVAAMVFWVIQEQGATVIAQYAEQSADLQALGFSMPASWFQSVGSLTLIILTPAAAVLWVRLGRLRRPPTTGTKFAAGLAIAGLSYLLLVIPSLQAGKSSPGWLVASLAVVTVGEMCLSPIGLAATSRLAPAAFATQTMGLWLASNAAGQGVSAQIVRFYHPDHAAGYFAAVGAGAVIAAVLLLAAVPLLRRHTEEDDGGDTSHQRSDEPQEGHQ
ncbi:peptide MFS transporter [Microlunatus soli]|uniref:Proton-dependent oligopeptide transporter, POT family n=1 Tax=Microlunatus soli TaxID=630515 RepID=A0A1H1N6E8_9ACTN|nr:oligopeptide:H+ symporter [Microlunatus soli]SDR94438.1 proton-dependent oligopeptide transporter, POT family [Microlunatus soli]